MPKTNFEQVYSKEGDIPSELDVFNHKSVEEDGGSKGDRLAPYVEEDGEEAGKRK